MKMLILLLGTHHVKVGCVTDISEEHTAFIIRAEGRNVVEVNSSHRESR
jgi:hypothetical protein